MTVQRPLRQSAVDIVRGAAVVLMALDHTRDYTTNLRFSPEDFPQSTLAIFATRWVTHFCAPAFALMAGVGIGLMAARGTPQREMRRFLVTRGLWLLVLELVVTPVGWQFGFEPLPVFALVLWALGWSMIVMAGAIALPPAVLATLSIGLIAGHNLADGIAPSTFGPLAPLWHFLHVPGFLWPRGIFIAYPLVPWVAVMALGYVLAQVYQWDEARRRRLLLGTGIAAMAGFVVLRALNGYGNPAPWRTQATTGLTVASFFNVLKYPPSLQFLLMALGPALVALALAERARGWLARTLAVYGRVPMFFYVAHIFVIHALAVLVAFVQSGEFRRVQAVTHPELIPSWYGLSLPGVYLAWIAVVAAFYLPCRAFGRMKARRVHWWLPYL